jgi:hypothetical protein
MTQLTKGVVPGIDIFRRRFPQGPRWNPHAPGLVSWLVIERVLNMQEPPQGGLLQRPVERVKRKEQAARPTERCGDKTLYTKQVSFTFGHLKESVRRLVPQVRARSSDANLGRQPQSRSNHH